MPEEVRAFVDMVDGQAVLHDPYAAAMVRAVSKVNCSSTLSANADAVARFQKRITERGDSPADVVITLISVDDSHGRDIADALMPGHDWQQYRDLGMRPYARGLARRDFIQHALGLFDEEAADRLATISGVAVVVVDHDVAECFAV